MGTLSGVDALSSLLHLLDREDQTFFTTLELFRSAFSRESRHSIALTLRLLLEDNYLNTVFAPTCIAYYLLYQLALSDHVSSQQQYRQPTPSSSISTSATAGGVQSGSTIPSEGGSAFPVPLSRVPPNTLSVLYEQVVQPIKWKSSSSRSAPTSPSTPSATTGGGEDATSRKTPDEWEEEEEHKVKIRQKLFIMKLFTGRTAEFESKSPRELLNEYSLERSFAELEQMLKEPSVQYVLAELRGLSQQEKHQSFGGLGNRGLSPLITIDERDHPTCRSMPRQRHVVQVTEEGTMPIMRFGPQFERPIPPIMELDDDEIIWLNTFISPPELLWDFSMCADSARSSEVRELISRAFKQRLKPAQEQQVLGELEADVNLIYYCGLTPKRLSELVENNPKIATEILLKLMSTPQITEYLSVLVNMDTSLQSIEVVNRLNTEVDLPKEFLHVYISNCIASCENKSDKSMQNRLARLVCVFLQSLIRNRIIDIDDIILEVKQFCVNFAKIREAATLYRLVTSWEEQQRQPGIGGKPPSTSSSS